MRRQRIGTNSDTPAHFRSLGLYEILYRVNTLRRKSDKGFPHVQNQFTGILKIYIVYSPTSCTLGALLVIN